MRDVAVRAAPDEAQAPVEAPIVRVLSPQLSAPGVAVGLLFFAFSLLPSMLPRAVLFQGVLSGVTVMIGYALGAGAQWVWRFVYLPQPRGAVRTVLVRLVIGIVGFFAASAVWRHVGWQNEVRALIGMEAITPVVLLPALVIAVAVAVLLLLTARSVLGLYQLTWRALARVLPRRVAILTGAVAVAVAINLLSTGVMANTFFVVSNQLFAARDIATDPGSVQPTSPLRSGGPGSLVSWSSLGRQGRAFVSSGPTVGELNAFTGGDAVEPIRVYAGLRSADTAQEQADLVLGELIRTDAFSREVLVIGTTTGTGLLDPRGVDPVEFIHNGDTAIVGVQYSYLPSWISLLADQDKTRRTARTVFDTVHGHWSTLPRDDRPELYLYGLSLGAFGTEAILSSVDVVNAPVDGALLVGPPFVNPLWREAVAGRDAGTPAWRPVYDGGRTVRFTGERFALDAPGSEWGPTRVAYLQHASDPVVFFSPDLVLREPDWLRDGQRGPGIADDFVYVPLVTFWQMAFDLPRATAVPVGWGHVYSAEANGAAWVAVTRPDGWSAADTTALRAMLAARPWDVDG